ncbi:MAG: pseudaminic acid cytidylyltransferase [Lachnospiraceae bacterium]|nr:pseudaminic acid cytidylyltransferase [Lachnospiraceae bacterium]
MSTVAIIIARGGSKRIPLKNIKNFCGKPIICYSIEAALNSHVFSKVMVSTDDMKIAEISKQAGATVPFFRSEKTAGDYATTDEVIFEVLEEYRKRGIQFDSFCCIYPTAPFITGGMLQEAMEMLEEHDSVTPVVRYSYPPQRGFVIRNGRLLRANPKEATTRSQDLEAIYHDCGLFYACRTRAFLEYRTTDVEDMVPIVLSEKEVQDIDTIEDWEIAEKKYRMYEDYFGKRITNPASLCTPYYIISEQELIKDIELLKDSLKSSWGNYICSYSVKTNSLPWLLKYFMNNDFYGEVVSHEEYDLISRIGFKPSSIIFNGPLKDKQTFEKVLLDGGIVNLDSSFEPVWLAEIANKYLNREFKVGVRVNYDLSELAPDDTLADEEGSRFGYCYENGELKRVIDYLCNIKNVRIVGIHLHSSTKTRSVKVYEALAEVAVLIGTEFKLNFEYIDMGGGFYGGLKDKPNFKDYIPAIANVLKKKYDNEKTKLIVEPGVSMVSSSFEFVTEVIDTKNIRGVTYVVTNGSRLNLNPQVTRRQYPHRIEYMNDNLKHTNIIQKQVICGGTCMEYDRLFVLCNETELRKGDLIIYTNAGGYTICLTPLFIHYFPAVYVKKVDGSIFTAREPWTNDEYLKKNYTE